MKITLEIRRFNPETDTQPHIETFEATAEPTDRLLSVLMDIKQNQDPTLAFRKSCAHGVCGSCAMVINGRERLACKTLVKDVATNDDTPVRVEPLRTLPVERDLMVRQVRFFENYAKVRPYLVNQEPAPDKERVQSPADHKKIEDGTNCILCAACYSACPVLQDENPNFIGPAASVQAARFNDDSRDHGFEQRLPVLDHANGVWACQNHFDCTRACPRGIKVTKHINLTKRRIKNHKGK